MQNFSCWLNSRLMNKENKADKRWDDENAEHKFANRATSWNTGDENADKWRPRYPPSPVEDGPAVDPGAAVAIQWLQVKAHWQEVGKIAADRIKNQCALPGR